MTIYIIGSCALGPCNLFRFISSLNPYPSRSGTSKNEHTGVTL